MTAKTLTVLATIEARAGEGDTMLAALKEMAAFKRGEPGCLMYGVNQDLEAPEEFVIFEDRSDEDALAGHMRGPQFGNFMKVVGGILAGRPTITKLLPIEP